MRSEIKSEIAGRVWKVLVAKGQSVAVDDQLIIIESMKMEIPVVTARPGVVAEIRINEGDEVAEGQVLAVVTA